MRDLQRDLATSLDVPALRQGVVAACVRSLTRGDVLFDYHADVRVMPASNMKLVTLAVAATRLGWDHAWETTVSATSAIDDEGVLHGDLVVKGSGDPGIDGPGAPRTFDAWAGQLWDHGLRELDGRLVGDDRAFAAPGLGAGWSWDDLGESYAAPIGALQVNENAAEVTVTPGPAEGAAAVVTIAPGESGLLIDPRVTTTAPGTAANVALDRMPGQPVLRVTGSVPVGEPVLRYAAVDHPTLYVMRMFASALRRRGIAVRDGIAAIGDLSVVPAAAGAPLIQWRSAPLSELAVPLMKNSLNLYAETLLRTIGEKPDRPATADDGRAVVSEQLAAWGIDPNDIVSSDGSGLSRYDYATARAIVEILRRMYDAPSQREAWLAALPVAGVDGTLRRRFKGSAAAGVVRAKTGSIANVRALSGYVPAAGGEWLAFSVIVNNVTAGGQVITDPVDRFVTRLVGFSR